MGNQWGTFTKMLAGRVPFVPPIIAAPDSVHPSITLLDCIHSIGSSSPSCWKDQTAYFRSEGKPEGPKPRRGVGFLRMERGQLASCQL